MKVKRIFLFIFLFTVIFGFSQGIEDNEFYKKAVEFLNLAKQEYDNGEYDMGYEHSEQAKEYFTKAGEFNLIRILLLQLNKEKERAASFIEKVKAFGIDRTEYITKLYNTAVKLYDEAGTFYTQGNEKTEYVEKGELFQKAIDNYIQTRKLCEMALTNSRDDRENALELLKKARDKRDNLIKIKVISLNDEDDADIMVVINDSQKSFDTNDYDTSKVKSREAINLMDKIRLKREAEEMLVKAKDLFLKSKDRGAQKDFPDKFSEANDRLNDADKSFNDEDYAKSIKNSKLVLDIINSLNYMTSDVFPKYYRVRRLSPVTDCFWKIARYPFIYNDPRKWKMLYDANKDKLTDTDNPNLIYPNFLLTIPSLNGEKREGEYDPSKKYPEFDIKKNY